MRYPLLLITGLALTLLACDDNEPTSGFPPNEGPRDSSGPIQVEVIGNDLITRTEKPGEPKTDELGRQVVGTYYDTAFGQVKGKAFFNFNLPLNSGFSDSFLNERIIDSAVLKIPLDGSDAGGFGDLNDIQTVKFFLLEEPVLVDDDFGARSEFAFQEQPVGRWTGTFEPGQSIRVKLNERFLELFRNASRQELTTNRDFLNLFNGLAAIPANTFRLNGEGALVYWQLINQASITFYQPNGADSVLVDQRSGRVNTFEYDRSRGAVELGGVNNQYAFFQPIGGLKTTMRVAGAKRLLDSGKLNVHKADITLPVNQSYHQDRQPPPLLEIWADENGEKALTDTAEYNPSKEAYVVDKPRYLQEILQAEAENRPAQYGALNFRLPAQPPRANLLLINGANNASKRGVTLEVTYSKVQNQ